MELSFDWTGHLISQSTDEGELHRMMEEAVREKLKRNFEELMQILYRLDVSEIKVKRVFQTLPEAGWPGAIASLILEREKQRLEFRRKYSAEGN